MTAGPPEANPYGDPRIAALYDLENARGDDTRFYVELAAELGARTIIDIGCGTGLLACELASAGRTVIGVDPAAAMLDVARRRPGGDRVTWLLGDATVLPQVMADLAVMTGHAAQEIRSDSDWVATLGAARRTLRPGGVLAFESRNPATRAWERWTPELTLQRLDHPTLGAVDTWYRVVAVDGEFVRYEAHNRFAATGEDLVAGGRLRFPARASIEESLADAGFTVERTFGDWDRGPLAPDSPEMIFVARTAGG